VKIRENLSIDRLVGRLTDCWGRFGHIVTADELEIFGEHRIPAGFPGQAVIIRVEKLFRCHGRCSFQISVREADTSVSEA